jgi:hypothetical protein
MAQIIPHIVKEKLPRELHFPLKYHELEECLAAHLAGDVFLDVHESTWRVYRDTPVEHRLPPDDHHLLQLRFDPEEPRSPHDPEPWRDLAERTVVHARLYAVPHAAMIPGGLWRELLRGALADALRRLAAPGLWAHRWELRVLLRGDERALEVWLDRWTGVRHEEPQRWRIDVPVANAEGGGR